jgi:hypothetical protein
VNAPTTATVSLGSVAIGLCIISWHVARWWKLGGKGGHGPSGGAGRDPKLLIPFASSVALGTLSVTAAGGLVGTLATIVLGMGNSVGNWSLTSVTGTVTPSVTRSGHKGLSPGGSVALVVYLTVLAALWKSGGKVFQGKVVAGVIAGMLLGLSAGFSGVAAAGVVTIFNAAGDKVTGSM